MLLPRKMILIVASALLAAGCSAAHPAAHPAAHSGAATGHPTADSEADRSLARTTLAAAPARPLRRQRRLSRRAQLKPGHPRPGHRGLPAPGAAQRRHPGRYHRGRVHHRRGGRPRPSCWPISWLLRHRNTGAVRAPVADRAPGPGQPPVPGPEPPSPGRRPGPAPRRAHRRVRLPRSALTPVLFAVPGSSQDLYSSASAAPRAWTSAARARSPATATAKTLTYVIRDSYGFPPDDQLLGIGTAMRYLQVNCGSPQTHGGAYGSPTPSRSPCRSGIRLTSGASPRRDPPRRSGPTVIKTRPRAPPPGSDRVAQPAEQLVADPEPPRSCTECRTARSG